MKYKILTIAVASLLPLGFAASASVANPTASHEVTFTVVGERSISVNQTTVDFGVVAQNSTNLLENAVTVTFSSPLAFDEDVKVTLLNSDGSSGGDLPTGVKLRAKSVDADVTAAGGDATISANFGGGQGSVGTTWIVAGNLDDDAVDETFDVGLTLEAESDATIGEETYLLRYSLVSQ